ncbi:MAG TPA: DUF427 domain-containing protein [Acidimicrobiales bacterium]|nr:DUF427 domain-containing protein [Acidimicrobiales bacterium]
MENPTQPPADLPRPPFAANVWTEPWPRRVRAFVGDVAVADSTRALILLERDHRPVFYFPPDDLRSELLEPSDTTTRCPRKGDASYWSIRVGDRLIPDAVWSYESPIAGREDITGYRALYWRKVDAWFEEDDEIFVHPKDPYSRVDVLSSSRHVVVAVDGEVVADTVRPRLLFETGLPTRYYVPKADVRMDLLTATDTSTQCPYKGVAEYWSVTVGDATYDDIAWSYPFPIPECPKIEGLVAFFNERVDITVDGELQARPKTAWSR